MSSAVWSIATMKKSILFDVLGVIDMANKTSSSKQFAYDYSLLKEETVSKYKKIYKSAINQNELLMSAFFVPAKEHNKKLTVIYDCLIDLAFDMCSFADMITWIEESDRSEFAYSIAAKCLSTDENEVTVDVIAKLVGENDMKVIDFLHKFSIPENVKMSIYLMIYYYQDFVKTLIQYLKDVHALILELYDELYFVFHEVEFMLSERLKDKNQRYQLLASFAQKALTEEFSKRKHSIVLSLIRLEYCWMQYESKYNFYLVGLFFVQRIIHDDKFEIF